MKSNYPVIALKGHVRQISQRSRGGSEIDVYSVTNSEGFTKSTDYFSKEVFSKDVSNYKIVNTGQFAYNPSRINVGSIDYLKCAEKALVSPLYVVFETSDKIHPDYLLRYLKADWGNLQIRANTEGAVRDSLKFKGLERIRIPLPDHDNQIRIAQLLRKVEGLISHRKENLLQLDELLKSVFLEMFGDPVRNNKGWEKPELKKFGRISTGNTPPRKDEASYSSRHIEWIKTDNIPSDSVYVTQAIEYLSERGSKKGRIVNKGALLVACIAGSVESIGRAALTNRAVAFNQQINAIQPNEEVNSFFLYVLFKMAKGYIQRHATKGMKKILTKGNFEKIKLIKPPIRLQNKFAQSVEKIENVRIQYQQSLTELENLYGALSQSAFKGELDLSTLTIEHILPLSTGYTHTPDNITVTHAPENRQIHKQFKPTNELTAQDDRFEYVAKQIKKEFMNFDFQFKDIIESQTFDNYRHCNTSEDLKKKVFDHEYDLKCYLFDCLEGKSSLLKLEQFYYDALDDLNLTKINFKVGNDVIKKQLNDMKQEQLSGIYFRIIQ